MCRLSALISLLPVLCLSGASVAAEERPRARDIGLEVGIFDTGPHNAITDVEGVRVGHSTLVSGEDIRTGVTAIIPAEGNLYKQPVSAALHVGNGYGKLIGASQLQEFGEIETPILLTCALCVWRAADALKEWVYTQPGMGEHTVNPVVGETNDGLVNNMWANPIGKDQVLEALETASDGPVAEGCVGAGTGTEAFGWKGGIGTSSRVLPKNLGGYTVGVLVQTNYGGVLSMNGAPVGRELKQYGFRDDLAGGRDTPEAFDGGSIMIVVATDAPLTPRNLERVAARGMMGLARTGSYASNGSGDYVIAFSSHPKARKPRSSPEPLALENLANEQMTPLFAATVEATEEAIYNAILKATTVKSSRGELRAIPLDEVKAILSKYQVLNWSQSLP